MVPWMRLRFYSTCASRMQHFAIIIGMFVHVTGRNRLYFAIDRSAVVRNMDFELLSCWADGHTFTYIRKARKKRETETDRQTERERDTERKDREKDRERKTERKTAAADWRACCSSLAGQVSRVPSDHCPMVKEGGELMPVSLVGVASRLSCRCC